MAFKISDIQQLHVEHSVTFHLGKGDDAKTLEFTATFLLLDDDATIEASKDGDEEFIRKTLKGWDGILDDDDKPLQFKKANLDKLMMLSWWRTGVIDAYYVAQATACRKN